jgi:DNA-binding transcriptional MocR family regulator
MRNAVFKHFVPGTTVTRPEGAYSVCIELPETIDALALYEQAILKGTTIAPGLIFSTKNKYRNYIRLNAAVWSDKVEKTIAMLGSLTKELGSRV